MRSVLVDRGRRTGAAGDLGYTSRMAAPANPNLSLAETPGVHTEKHSNAGPMVRDVVIGMSDGLTVPFALAAGLSGAVGSTRVVVLAGLAEIAAGSIAMGLGGYLAARGDEDHYAAERRREEREIVERTRDEEEEIFEVFAQYEVPRAAAAPVLEALKARPKHWVDFMMRFELGLEEPEEGRAFRSAATIAGSYVVGGLLPLLPYMLLHSTAEALVFSVLVTMGALVVFGALKGRVVGTGAARSATQMLLTGGAAALAAYALARLLQRTTG